MVTLERLGYIQCGDHDRDFRLALKTYALGQKMVRMMPVSQIAMPHMQAMADDLRLDASLAVLDHEQGVFIQKAEPPGGAHLDTYVGRRMDLHCTALGKIILAFSPADSTKRIFAKRMFKRYTPETKITVQALRKEIGCVRRQGFALDNEEEELGIRGVGAPILKDCSFIAALSVSGTLAQIPLQSIGPIVARLKQAATALAAENVPLPSLW
jgi:DNA-binding IclR family transcriptional regulator